MAVRNMNIEIYFKELRLIKFMHKTMRFKKSFYRGFEIQCINEISQVTTDKYLSTLMNIHDLSCLNFNIKRSVLSKQKNYGLELAELKGSIVCLMVFKKICKINFFDDDDIITTRWQKEMFQELLSYLKITINLPNSIMK